MTKKAPPARGFTLAEKRSLQFEKVALYAVFFVAIVAAIISFVALESVGREAGLGWASILLPLAIDGFGIACSVGIVRSVSSGEGWRDRFSEWTGLVGALVLSILGNVHHSLAVGSPTLPDYVKVAYAGAIPMIVAYGIHVYGRAMTRGISAHVLADDPDQLVFGLTQLGDAQTLAAAKAPVRTTRAPATSTPRAPRAASASEDARTVSAPPAAPARTPRAATEPTGERARAHALFNAAIAGDPTTKPDAARIHADLNTDKNPATTRRWVAAWWQEHIDATMLPETPDVEAPAQSDASRVA